MAYRDKAKQKVPACRSCNGRKGKRGVLYMLKEAA